MDKLKNSITLFILLATFGVGYSQSIKISGTVLDRDNKAIPGANVLQIGTSNGKACDWNGKFEIELSEGDHTLLFAFIGYKTFEYPIKIEKQSNVSLEIILVKDERKNRKLNSSGKKSAKRSTFNR